MQQGLIPNFENIVVALAFFVVAAIALFAVFNPDFDDSLVQRIALSAACIAALGSGWSALTQDMPTGIDLAAIAAAAYAVECLRIRWYRRQTQRRRQEDRKCL